MLNRRALFGLPLAALPCSSPRANTMLDAAFACGYQARTHLTNIVGFSALVTAEDLPAARRDEYVGYIDRSAHALTATIDALLDVFGSVR